jgi:hypothetical protein
VSVVDARPGYVVAPQPPLLTAKGLAKLTTDKHLDLITEIRASQILFDVVLCDKPSLNRRVLALLFVDEIHHIKRLGIFLLQLIKLVAQQNVLLRDVTIEESEFGRISWVADCIRDDLIKRSDPRATTDESDLFEFVGYTKKESIKI